MTLKRIAISLLLLLLAAVPGCGSQSVSSGVTGDPSAEIAAGYLGTWEIESGVPTSLSTLTQEEIDAWAGQTFTYAADRFSSQSEELLHPVYSTQVVSGADFTADFGVDSQSLFGMENLSLTQVTVEQATGMGATFYYSDSCPDILVLSQSGGLWKASRSG